MAIREHMETFGSELRWVRPRVLLVEYSGRMPSDEKHTRELEATIGKQQLPVALCYDVTHLASFDRAQVALHAEVYNRVASRVVGVALVGARPAARFGAITVGLMSKIVVQSFDERSAAIEWLEGLVGQ